MRWHLDDFRDLSHYGIPSITTGVNTHNKTEVTHRTTSTEKITTEPTTAKTPMSDSKIVTSIGDQQTAAPERNTDVTQPLSTNHETTHITGDQNVSNIADTSVQTPIEMKNTTVNQGVIATSVTEALHTVVKPSGIISLLKLFFL